MDDTSPVWTEISFLARHGRAGHKDYASGAIESTIRRVINLRIEGNSIFWKVRGLVLSRRWPETFAKITDSMARDRRLSWQWSSPDMVAQLQAPAAIKPPTPQPQSETARRSCMTLKWERTGG